MTEAEENLVKVALQTADFTHMTRDAVGEAALKVAMERLPPEYEANLRDLWTRAWDALDAAQEYTRRSPIGHLIAQQVADERRKAGRL